jgi:hypothetical protein
MVLLMLRYNNHLGNACALIEIYEVIFYLNRKQYLKKGTVEEQGASLPSTWHIR